MTKDPAGEQQKVRSATPEDEKQAAERRRLQDAREDDEVREALMSLHAEKEKTKAKA
jgi:hypothetical protein